ncbi:MAG: helix-turn-helix domain-containing protein [Pseudomonadales bacterium]|nr:helix-turn-helix domain-containing protein [Pseudomonadales bacterium]
MSKAFAIPERSYRADCANCPQRALCLPPGLSGQELSSIEAIVEHGSTRHNGDHIYRQGDGFTGLFAIRSGSAATYQQSAKGFEQVSGFHYSGSMLGMDGIAVNRHRASAVALETTSICRIPFDHICRLGQQIPALHRHVFRRLSEEIAATQQLLMVVGKYSAEQRVASLVLRISHDCQRRQLSAIRFSLPMSRQHIGNHLALTVETVSRALMSMHRGGILHIESRQVTIRDMERLDHLAKGVEKRRVAPVSTDQARCADIRR